jgi:hypothetical protein
MRGSQIGCRFYFYRMAVVMAVSLELLHVCGNGSGQVLN